MPNYTDEELALLSIEDLSREDLRRDSSDERSRFNIKNLWERSHEIINLAAIGYKHVDIAQILNITPKCVSETLNSDLGQKKLMDIRGDRDVSVKVQIEKVRVLTNKALKVYHEIFENESGEYSSSDKRKTADTILLELSGLRAPTKIQTHNISTQLTAEELEEFKQRGRDFAAENSPNNTTIES